MKKECKRIFIDSAPVIYLLDNDTKYVSAVKSKIKNAIKNGTEIVISPVTVMEYLVIPYKEGRYDRIASFYDFIEGLNIEVCNIDMQTAEKTAQIRSSYDSFKSLDAFQLSCAVMNGCDLFLTNDKQLKRFKEIEIDCLS